MNKLIVNIEIVVKKKFCFATHLQHLPSNIAMVLFIQCYLQRFSIS